MAKASEIIKELGDTNWGDDNEKQMKAVQLLKGLAVSEEEISNIFMKSLSDASTHIAKKILEAKNENIQLESVTDRANAILEDVEKMEKPKTNQGDDLIDRASDLL